jgi:hypothetical protein
MELEDKSAEKGITDGLKVISYVANNEGSQELVSGSMWQPINIVNRQAWLEIEKQIEASKLKITSGRVSCLHYYMAANQMDVSLLAKYTRQPRWLVFLHMIPFIFNRLSETALDKYTEVFKVSRDALLQGKLEPPVYNHREFEERSDD